MAIVEKWKVVWTDNDGETVTATEHDTLTAAESEVSSKESTNGGPSFSAYVTKVTYSDTV